MKYIKFSIFDSKAGGFLPDWNAINIPTAIRLFQDGIAAPDSAYGKHPGDYSLFEIGTFDQETGDIEKCSPKIDHGTALVLKVRAELEQRAELHHHNNADLVALSRAELKADFEAKETTPS